MIGLLLDDSAAIPSLSVTVQVVRQRRQLHTQSRTSWKALRVSITAMGGGCEALAKPLTVLVIPWIIFIYFDSCFQLLQSNITCTFFSICTYIDTLCVNAKVSVRLSLGMYVCASSRTHKEVINF